MSNLQVRFLGQSGFQLTKGGSSILIDPSVKKAGDVDGKLVYCTHRHPDHTGGITRFMERNSDAVLLTNEQVARVFRQFSDRTVMAHDGGSYRHNEWEFQFIEARHGLFAREKNLGVIVRNGDDSFGHCGDTVTFEGFSSIQVDTLAIPITGILTASPVGAISELKKFDQPLPTIVVMHWGFRNPDSFCRRLSREIPGTRYIVPKKGELLPL
ncbi:MAG: MBL fold metallo-hydrolase [Candidatus Bathyarchaeota archaeon]|nr:MAG: MBL fold metallo-hydrolase [Candidatus Bathyarchaeota archaeon]